MTCVPEDYLWDYGVRDKSEIGDVWLEKEQTVCNILLNSGSMVKTFHCSLTAVRLALAVLLAKPISSFCPFLMPLDFLSPKEVSEVQVGWKPGRKQQLFLSLVYTPFLVSSLLGLQLDQKMVMWIRSYCLFAYGSTRRGEDGPNFC